MEMNRKSVSGGCNHNVLKGLLTCVGRMDNSAVYVASSKCRVEPVDTIKRDSSAEKRRIDFPCPDLVKWYIAMMEYIDLIDKMVAHDRFSRRMRMWYWPLFYWVMPMLEFNAWRLKRYFNKSTDSYLTLLRELSVKMLKKCGTPPTLTRRSMSVQMG